MHFLYATCRSQCNKSANRDITPFPLNVDHVFVVSTEFGICLIHRTHSYIFYHFVIDRKDYMIRISQTNWKYKYIVNVTRYLMMAASKFFKYNSNCVYRESFTDVYNIGINNG